MIKSNGTNGVNGHINGKMSPPSSNGGSSVVDGGKGAVHVTTATIPSLQQPVSIHVVIEDPIVIYVVIRGV